MSRNKSGLLGNLAKGVAKATVGLMVCEAGLRWWEKLYASNRYHFWRNYYSNETLEQVDQLIYATTLRSTGVTLHLDLFQQNKRKSPVVILNHGAAGYGKLLLPLALRLYERGYNIILPDRKGQGFSGGTRGDYTIKESTGNIVDVIRWANVAYEGPIYVAGGSLGGALSYYAACETSHVKAVACLNLFDFSFNSDGIRFTGIDRYVDSHKLSIALEIDSTLSTPWQWCRIPFNWILSFENMMEDEDKHFLDYWYRDPLPNRMVSLRSLYSYLNSPPPIPFELNELPVLVLNQEYDHLADPELTRNNYDRLEGPKDYHTLPFGHWASRDKFWDLIAQKSDEWFSKQK